jgi:hypothetical protein
MKFNWALFILALVCLLIWVYTISSIIVLFQK